MNHGSRQNAAKFVFNSTSTGDNDVVIVITIIMTLVFLYTLLFLGLLSLLNML